LDSFVVREKLFGCHELAMAKASVALSELVEKGAKDDVVRELLGHIVKRLTGL